MWLFKKKKIYAVEYKDTWNAYGNSVVKAYDMADAWKQVRKQRYDGSPYKANICISIKEVKDGENTQ